MKQKFHQSVGPGDGCVDSRLCKGGKGRDGVKAEKKAEAIQNADGRGAARRAIKNKNKRERNFLHASFLLGQKK